MRAALVRGIAGRAPAIAVAIVTVALPFVPFACTIDDRELTVPHPDILLVSDAQGFVDGSNRAGILGYWTYLIDTPTCSAAGYSAAQCSTLFDSSGNAAGSGAPVHPSDLATGRICISGVAAQTLVNPVTLAPDYDAIWGAGIQLTLNDPADDVATSQAYDAPAHMITGISFETDTPPPSVIRVAFPGVGSPAAGDPYWGGKLSWFSPTHAGLNVFSWADVGPQFDSTYPPFDPRTMLRMQFHVSALATQATPFDFCIWNLSARTE